MITLRCTRIWIFCFLTLFYKTYCDTRFNIFFRLAAVISWSSSTRWVRVGDDTEWGGVWDTCFVLRLWIWPFVGLTAFFAWSGAGGDVSFDQDISELSCATKQLSKNINYFKEMFCLHARASLCCVPLRATQPQREGCRFDFQRACLSFLNPLFSRRVCSPLKDFDLPSHVDCKCKSCNARARVSK